MSASFLEDRLVCTEPVNFMSYRCCKSRPVSPQIADGMLPATQWRVARVGIRNEKISETFLWIECWNNFENYEIFICGTYITLLRAGIAQSV
jgi:hypothetical protein